MITVAMIEASARKMAAVDYDREDDAFDRIEPSEQDHYRRLARAGLEAAGVDAAPRILDLVDDLVSWWHVYPDQGQPGVRQPWDVTGEPLPLGLDDAAKLFLDHAMTRLISHVRREHEQAWRRLYETTPRLAEEAR